MSLNGKCASVVSSQSPLRVCGGNGTPRCHLTHKGRRNLKHGELSIVIQFGDYIGFNVMIGRF